MKTRIPLALLLILPALCPAQKLNISGIYPNLVMTNREGMQSQFGEAGIGALVPWGGKLWGITYTCHALHGSSDKLHEIDANLNRVIRPESVGGTHANRMIHRESEQLIIGPYFIRQDGTVRVAQFPDRKYGRLTAVTRHLHRPAHMVYFYDMEGIWYEVDVESLAVTKLHDKPVPGWHGKGAYIGQGRFIIANNGINGAPSPYWASPRKDPDVASRLEAGYQVQYDADKDPERAGLLAEYDGRQWRIVEDRQYTDVCGPGGLYGNMRDTDPVWAIGWDKRSLRLKLLDQGRWHTYLLPKASHCFEHASGIFTEWPRFREVGRRRWLLDMFGMFFNWPQHFHSGNTAGLTPLSSHLRYIPDFGHWNGRVFLGADDAAKVTNPIPPGLNQSNIWFGDFEDLKDFGPIFAWGGPWLQDPVQAGRHSLPFLVNGFQNIMVHLQHDGAEPVAFTAEINRLGDSRREEYATVPVPARGYRYFIFPRGFRASWIRLRASRDCRATAYFFLETPYPYKATLAQKFAALAEIRDRDPINTGLVWPDTQLNLQYLQRRVHGQAVTKHYREVRYEAEADTLVFAPSQAEQSQEVQEPLPVGDRGFEVDDASVIYTYNGKRYRLPKGDAAYSQTLPEGHLRSHREVQSERALMNVHGTFYEIPRERVGIPAIKPISSHTKRIKDYGSWRGLLVFSGTRADADPDGNYFGSGDAGLWFGKVDDLWQLGKPVGRGGPLLNTPVRAGQPSEPYLMTRYDRKSVRLSHDQPETVRFTIEVDYTHHGTWAEYNTFAVKSGEALSHGFPYGYHAHWVRVVTDRDCQASAQFSYE